MIVRFFLLIAVLSAGAVRTGAAQAVPASPDTVVTLAPVTVTAARAAVSAAAAPARVTVLDAEALDATAAATVADVLTQRTGVFVRRYGPGGLASLSLRGTGAAQTVVLLDGHRLTDPQLGQVDLSLLPTLLLASLDVLHGAASPLYGSDGLGGAVHLHSRTPGAAPQASVLASAGAYGERLAGLRLEGGRGRWHGLALGEHEAAEGDFAYRNDALFPAREVRRRNADRRRTSLYGTLGYDAPAGRVRAAAWYTGAERGLPGLAAAPAGDERQWDDQLRVWADARYRLAGGTTLRLGGLAQHARLRYRNGELALDETGRTRRYALDVEATRIVGQRWLAGAGVQGSTATADHPSLGAAAREAQGALFAYATGAFGRLLVYPALRADVHAPHDQPRRVVLSPRLGMNLRTGPLRWKAAAGRAFRAPTFNDRFWRDAGARGSADLRPETGWSVDAGVWAPLGAGRLEATAYRLAVRDQIVWTADAGVWRPENRSRVRTRGLEVSYRHRRRLANAAAVEGGMFYTLTDARDRSEPGRAAYGERLRYVPPHQVKAHVDAAWGAWSALLSGRWVGARPVRTDGSLDLDPYAVLDAQLRLRLAWPWAEATFALALDNLLDADYEVIQGYPMPPRHLRVRLLVHTR